MNYHLHEFRKQKSHSFALCLLAKKCNSIISRNFAPICFANKKMQTFCERNWNVKKCKLFTKIHQKREKKASTPFIR